MLDQDISGYVRIGLVNSGYVRLGKVRTGCVMLGSIGYFISRQAMLGHISSE
jgi:hypothetical protein